MLAFFHGHLLLHSFFSGSEAGPACAQQDQVDTMAASNRRAISASAVVKSEPTKR